MILEHLSIQNFYEPIGIDQNPIFKWELGGTSQIDIQSAYRIIISDTQDRLNKDSDNLFDSGMVHSDKQNNIEISIKLESHKEYFYKVFAYDLDKNECSSQEQSFVTGVIGDWKAKWISNGTQKPFYALKNYTVKKDISKAFCSVCGLGHFELNINGEKVGDHVLDSGWTNYNKQVQYVTFDVTKELRNGTNYICAEVGNGWYIGDTSEGRHFYTMDKGYQPFGNCLPLILQMTVYYEDGSIEQLLTDTSWDTSESGTTLANIYGSEDYDGRKANGAQELLKSNSLNTAVLLGQDSIPKGTLTSQSHPPVKIKKTYDAIEVYERNGGIILDLGQNMSGQFEIFVKGKAGHKIKIIPAEKLLPNGDIQKTCESWLTYTLKGTGQVESWKPRFTYSAGRWVKIEGVTLDSNVNLPQILDVKGHFITSSAKDVGEFSCDDERYNKLFHIINKAIESNLNHVHSDCPTIERLGWLETSHLMAPSVMFNKNVDTLWTKIERDMKEAQYEPGEHDVDVGSKHFHYTEGLIPSIAPRYALFDRDWSSGSFWDIVPWGSSIILSTLHHYHFYGNTKVIQDNYDSARKYVRYLADKYHSYNEIYNKTGCEKFICHGLGDWGVLQEGTESRENVETAFFYYNLKIMAWFAHYIDKLSDEDEFDKLASEVLEGYNKSLLIINPEDGNWCYKAYDKKEHISVTQTNQALPLYFGMVPKDKLESVKKSFLRTVENRQINSGEIGLRFILQLLSDMDQNDIVHDMIMQPEHPSYIRFIEQGETTLPEFWQDDARSRNHDMMGHIMEWFFNGVAGISSKDGFKNIIIAPKPPCQLHNVHCSYHAITGMIKVDMIVDENSFYLDVTVPTNTTAKIILPIKYHDKVVTCNGMDVNSTGFTVNGGQYKINISLI